MRGRTFALSQKELQRVSVISACIKGDMTCARAGELLSLSARQVKRLKKRMGEDGEAALAHVSRGRPSPRRLPDDRVRRQVVHLWPAPPMPGSTIIISPKNFMRSRVSPCIAKPCANCYAPPV